MSTVPDIEFEHGLPQNLDAERTILGAVMLDNKAYNEAALRLSPADFALTAHQRVFQRMGELLNAGHVCDIVTLAEELSKRKEIESVGGVAWLASLTEGLPRRIAIAEYVTIVREKSLLRRLIQVHSSAITRAADQSERAETILSEARSQIEEIATESTETGLLSAGEFLGQTNNSAESLMERPARERGIQTGITQFDEMTCGLQKGELIVVAARPSMGKSDWADNVAGHASVNLRKVVALFSIEMSRLQVVSRIICAQGRINRSSLKKGLLSSEDRRYFEDAHEELKAAPLYIDDRGGLTVSRVRSECLHLKARAGLDLVIVDFLQLMSAADMPRKYNREQEVSGISRGLKLLAKELEVPLVAMAQLSRDNTKRTDKRPILSDLRESGAIEQDADLVAFLHREEYYDPKNEDVKGKGEIIIAKQRNGPTGTVEAAYAASIGRWCDVETASSQTEFSTW